MIANTVIDTQTTLRMANPKASDPLAIRTSGGSAGGWK